MVRSAIPLRNFPESGARAIVDAMTYFPRPNPAKPATRTKLSGSVVVGIRSCGTQPSSAKLHEISATGGLLIMPTALEQGEFVEVAFKTSQGTVRAMAELLAVKKESASGCLQPFRFIALDDEDHARLSMALDSLSHQTMKHPVL
jgi:hypothetical protein